ncbi:MAG TPA: hypothetical protein VK070_10995 [Acidimicrobiia bacterium]|nr:hypothetical protein [Acidimicrobiia bacterium]
MAPTTHQASLERRLGGVDVTGRLGGGSQIRPRPSRGSAFAAGEQHADGAPPASGWSVLAGLIFTRGLVRDVAGYLRRTEGEAVIAAGAELGIRSVRMPADGRSTQPSRQRRQGYQRSTLIKGL